MAGTKLVHVGSLKKGNYIVMDGQASVIKDLQVSRPGKHGHAKIRVEAVGIMDGKKRQIVMPGHDNVETPIIDKLNAQVLSISGDTANVMDMESYETFDMKIPEDLLDKVKDGVTVLYWDILGDKVIKQIKGD
ncbi:translation initiation factor IF-5A [archaeon]|jgi:translation initiation factor 5A|nr:translation initiation factor IF-5A [archaeon]MBT4271977.1 translation initiation factor IF-5A [archaeon]MBT4461815.1 translation initiation factor IF-5A [archaeon]MBT4858170.1 translation initiation factor IF-5A [archaeon]MBT5424055.1 translation initiation factor IF-5A [archaeon]